MSAARVLSLRDHAGRACAILQDERGIFARFGRNGFEPTDAIVETFGAGLEAQTAYMDGATIQQSLEVAERHARMCAVASAHFAERAS